MVQLNASNNEPTLSSIMVFLGFQASCATYFLADAVTEGACFLAEYLKVLLRNAI
jgi:hypothetical protein